MHVFFLSSFYLIKYDENTVGYDIGFSYAVFCSLTFFLLVSSLWQDTPPLADSELVNQS